jgi:predicted N-acetyltransferase YhbS
VNRIRTATPGDAEAVGLVTQGAFGGSHGEWVAETCRLAPEAWRVLEHNGRVVSVCQVQIHGIRVGRYEINKGDVGHVSTLPEFQGRGFGSELMRDTVGYLKEAGCQVGRLGGLIAFYSRFGWVPFPRRYYEFPIEPARAGAKTLQPDEYLQPPEGFRGSVVPLDPVRHHEGRACLHEAFNRNRTGSIAISWGPPPPRDTAEPDTTGLRLACEIEGELAGYIFAFERPQDHTAFEAQVEIGETAFDYRKPEALGALVAQVLRVAYERGAKRVTGRLPFDERVESALRAAGVAFHLVEIHTAPASNMIRIVDLLGLLKRIAPELEARLAASAVAEWNGEIAFCLDGGQSATIESKGGSLGVWDWTPGEFRVDLDQATLLKLVLGLRSFSECAQVHAVSDARAATEVCNALFPRQPTASGVWG